MSDTVIKIENLGKKYLIRHQESVRYTALRDVLTNKFKSFGKRLITLQPPTSNLQPSREDFWALKDVSFEVKQGEGIGIIGRNGAGKTTLLKLLSRITEPTVGRIVIKGRVASLLEVGTGFHPELTGRENIFLNGAILGMSKSEIKRKFDEIVDFAEIEKFLDTPVKRYSSGMYVRLAFAIAAHLEPEILLVDEVLAVGDAGFQKKCLSKIEEVGKGGRTVLLVSHQMQVVQSITKQAILLREGKIHKRGCTPEVASAYLGQSGGIYNLTNMTHFGTSEGRFCELRIFSGNNESPKSIFQGEKMTLEFSVCVESMLRQANLAIAVRNPDGIELFSHSWSDEYGYSLLVDESYQGDCFVAFFRS